MKRISALLMSAAALTLAACATTHESVETASNTEAVATRAPAADVGVDYIFAGGPAANLEKCGGRDGSARLVRTATGLVLSVRNIDCAWYSTAFSGGKQHLLGSQNNFYIDLPVREDIPGFHQVTIGSERYFDNPGPNSKGDIIRFFVPPQVVVLDLNSRSATRDQRLSACGGTVRAQINNGAVNLVFRDVAHCNMFDIVGANGESLSYQANQLDDRGETYGGGRTIPKRYMEAGHNSITLRVYRGTNPNIGDAIRVNFSAY